MTFGLIAFDLDGTLVDSLRDLAESANALLVESGAAPLTEDAIGRMVGDGAATLVRRAFEAAHVPQPADALARFLRIYDSRLLRCTRPYGGVPDLLTALRARAVPLAVLTNKPLAATREILGGLDLARFFPDGAVLGGDGPLARKPDPAGLLHLARMAGAPPNDVLLVGDSIVDHRTARAASARICMAGYGFGFRDFPSHELAAADWVIDSPHALVTLL